MCWVFKAPCFHILLSPSTSTQSRWDRFSIPITCLELWLEELKAALRTSPQVRNPSNTLVTLVQSNLHIREKDPLSYVGLTVQMRCNIYRLSTKYSSTQLAFIPRKASTRKGAKLFRQLDYRTPRRSIGNNRCHERQRARTVV